MFFLKMNKHIQDSQSRKFYSMETRQDWYIMEQFMLFNLAGQVSCKFVVLPKNDIAKELHSSRLPKKLAFLPLNVSWT